MWKALSIFILVVILITALSIAIVVDKYREKAIYRKRLLAELKRQSDELLDTIELIEQVDKSYDVVQDLNRHYIQIIESIQQSNDNTYDLSGILQAALDRKKLHTSASAKEEYFSIKSLSQIPKIQNAIYKADKTLKLMTKKGRLSTDGYSKHKLHLNWLKAKIEQNAYVEQGDLAASNNDHASAIAYYNRAKEIIVPPDIDESEENKLFKIVNDKIRTQLELKHYNKTKRTPSNSQQTDSKRPDISTNTEPNSANTKSENSPQTTLATVAPNTKPILITPHGNKKSIK